MATKRRSLFRLPVECRRCGSGRRVRMPERLCPDCRPQHPLELRCELRAWTLGDLAKRAKVSRASINALLSGAPISAEITQRIATAIGLPPDRLLRQPKPKVPR